MSDEKLASQIHEDLKTLIDASQPVARLANVIKLVSGALFACVFALAAVVVWVKGQTAGLVAAQSAIIAIETDRRAVIAEWTIWRRSKDDNDVRFHTSIEAQQKLMERQQTLIEKITDRPRS